MPSVSKQPEESKLTVHLVSRSAPTPAQQERAVVADEAALAAAVSAAHAVLAAEQAESDEEAAQKAADKNRPPCPHCGRLLRLEHDLGDHLHCDSVACVGCCFDPGPVLRPNYPACPANTSR